MISNLICKLFGHRWVDLYSHILNKPFRECRRCGIQELWDDALEKEIFGEGGKR